MPLYADVILPLPLADTYTYLLPPLLQSVARVGCRLLVPFGARREYAAIICELHSREPQAGIQVKEAIAFLDVPRAEAGEVEPLVLPSQLTLWHWIADYYLSTLGEVSRAALPAPLKAVKPLASASKVPSAIPATPLPTIALPPLSPLQAEALASLERQFADHDVCLLHGVTGSGKTLVYAHLIAQTLASGGQVLYLLPEIVLTTQLVSRLTAVFGSRLAVYHSRYPDGRRAALWRRQLSASPFPLVVGVRSSVFLPFRRLSLVIVDEEHETSFKQQDPSPRYHARNVALMLARQAGARVLLGSATPCVETYRLALSGRYGLARLTERYGAANLPRVVAVDMMEQRRRKLLQGPFSQPLLSAMREAITQGQQVILFQNRRGYAPHLRCPQCGWVPRCARCSVSLVSHRSASSMVCHYCGTRYPLPPRCPACGAAGLRPVGYGTERIEDWLSRLLPTARLLRMDQDTTRSPSAAERLLSQFARGEADVLVGTQMVAKGLDLERVTLVGILDADALASAPDFRAVERAFQLMAQVAGRAGRRSSQGLVVVQTADPSSPLVDQVVRQDYESLYHSQLSERQAACYPPFCRLVYAFVRHRHAQVAEALAASLASLLRQSFGDEAVLGPDEPPVSMVRLMHIRQLMLKVPTSASTSAVRSLLRSLRSQLLAQPPYRSAQLYFDVDPY